MHFFTRSVHRRLPLSGWRTKASASWHGMAPLLALQRLWRLTSWARRRENRPRRNRTAPSSRGGHGGSSRSPTWCAESGGASTSGSPLPRCTPPGASLSPIPRAKEALSGLQTAAMYICMIVWEGIYHTCCSNSYVDERYRDLSIILCTHICFNLDSAPCLNSWVK